MNSAPVRIPSVSCVAVDVAIGPMVRSDIVISRYRAEQDGNHAKILEGATSITGGFYGVKEAGLTLSSHEYYLIEQFRSSHEAPGVWVVVVFLTEYTEYVYADFES